MTGAPKERAVRLLHQLEDDAPRGYYSGCFGYVSLHGAMHLSVIIRTAVFNMTSGKVSVGAGGAITFLSQPQQEWQEVLLKVKKLDYHL
jgi:para-aminobenzoate synthetase